MARPDRHAGTPGAEQTGVVVAHDVEDRQARRPIYGMGRHNHENDVAIPGFDDLVVLSGDDTFFTTPVTTTAAPQSLTYDTRAWSQLYIYIAPDTDALWADEGDLWAFVSDDPSYNDYFDFTPGDTTESRAISSRCPSTIATGKKADGTELRSTDFPGMLPPPPGSANPGRAAVGARPVGQRGEHTSVRQRTCSDFVRIEDIAYDKRPGMSNVVYLADSGRAHDRRTGLRGKSTNGRIWKLAFSRRDAGEALDPHRRRHVCDRGSAATPAEAQGSIHQPDNVETTVNGASSCTRIRAPRTRSRRDRPMRRRRTRGSGGTASRAARSRSPRRSTSRRTSTASNLDPSKPGSIGSWESSGVVDASSILGPGWFLLDVQAHTLWIEKAPGPDVVAPAGPDWTFKREGGQLLAAEDPRHLAGVRRSRMRASLRRRPRRLPRECRSDEARRRAC